VVGGDLDAKVRAPEVTSTEAKSTRFLKRKP
jgi:hypothetical protein